MKKRILISLILIALISPFAFSDYGNYGESARYYNDAKVVRVKYVRGESFVNRSYNDGVEEATVNLSIFEGDTAGTTDGRMEIYLGRLNYLRLDYDSEVKFVKIPALRKTRATLNLVKGGVYLDITSLDDERDIVIQTQDCGLFLLRRGLYRINVNEYGRTEVFVYEGLAEVAGNDYSRNIRQNQKVVMRNGRVIERPFYFYSSNTDDFDTWNKSRMRYSNSQRYSSNRYLNRGYEEYEYELTRAGRWQYNNEYNTNVWIPYNIGRSWRPYSNGRWVWHPVYGYVWNSYDSWGYYTHHYGRWHWSSLSGWYWLPGYRWSPAWVSWCYDDYYWGWTPLSYYNRPVVVINGRWNRRYGYRNGIPWNSRSMIIIRKNQLMAPRINKVALRKSQLSRISKRNFKYRGRAPLTAPHFKKVSVINSKGIRKIYKRNGLLSYKKYKTIGNKSIYKRIGTKINYKKYKTNSRVIKPAFKYSSKSKLVKPSYKYSTKSRVVKPSYKYSSKSKLTSPYGYSTKTKTNSTYHKKTYKKSGTKYKYKSNTYKNSSIKKIKKKVNSPYSYNSRRSYNRYNGSDYGYKNKTYSSPTYKSKSYSKPSYGYRYKSKSYGSSNSYNSPTYKYKSYSSPTYTKKKTYSIPSYGYRYKSKSYSSPSYGTSGSYRSNRNYSTKSYSTPSYKSNYRSSTKSYKSYSKPSNRSYSSPKTYSRSTSSYKSSSSRTSSSSSGSSHKSYKKK